MRAFILVCAGVCAAFLRLYAADQGGPADTGGLQTSFNQAEEYISFSFDQVDVATFVKLVGEKTGKKFAVAENVKGKITIVSPRVKRSEVYPLFVSILEMAGCSVIQDGDVYRVVALGTRDTPIAPVVGVSEQIPDEGLVTKIFRLEHVSVAEVAKVLESKVTGGKTGGVGAIEETNHLIVTDTASSVKRIEKLISQIDQPGLVRVTEVVPLQFVAAEALADQLNQAMAESQTRAEQLVSRLPRAPGTRPVQPRGLSVIPSPHSNSLLLVGSKPQVEQIKDLIRKMDVDAPAGRTRLNPIFVKYVSAKDVAENINALLEKTKAKPEVAGAPRTISIQADVANNALLVDASPSEFDVVKKLVESLDKPAEQVHIGVKIVEVTESSGLNLGVEMAAVNMPGEAGKTTVVGASRLSEGSESILSAIQQNLFPRGLSVGVLYGTRVDAEGRVVVGYPALLNLEAIRKDSRFKILSEPSLVTQNNKEASVSIVDEIPVLKSTITGGTGTARDVIQNIDRMEVGMKLKLTPHIIPGGDVRMDLNPSIEAVIDPGPSGTYTPTIAKREVSTTVTVPDGRTIVIAGLTKSNQTKVRRRVPILGSIPLLGLLFRYNSDVTETSDLLIFVTPRVVSTISDAEAVRADLEGKAGLKNDGDK
ncbi:MAG: type II secretion system secretin GspD [Kiritimatiellia bacterium]